MEQSSQSVSPDNDVRVQKLSHAVADRLRTQIILGQRKPGEKLPLESELIAQFKVSRPTVREALRVLEVESLITVGRGARAGATVLGASVERAAEYAAMVLASAGTTIGELHEARAQIEPAIVFQLAKKRDRKLFDQLQMHVDAGLQAMSESNYPRTNECLANFHAVLVHGSENRALVLMVQMLRAMQQQSHVAAETANTPEAVQLNAQAVKALQAYQELVNLLRQNKSEGAQTHWRKYMERAQAFLERSGVGARRIRHS